MPSKTAERRAAYWQQWRLKNRPPSSKPCENCGAAFVAKGPQKRCGACAHPPCKTCGQPTKGDGGHVRRFCSRSCVGSYPSNVERIGLQRGKKPRTRHLTQPRKRDSAADVEWRMSVFTRDAFTCQLCGVKGGRLHADHIKPFSRFPSLRYELSNGRALCVECHQKTPTFGAKARRLEQEVLPLCATNEGKADAQEPAA